MFGWPAGDRPHLARPAPHLLERLLHRGRARLRHRRHLGGARQVSRPRPRQRPERRHLPAGRAADRGSSASPRSRSASGRSSVRCSACSRSRARAAILFGRRFGLLAALLYATYPGDVFFSTVVMPDAIQAGWLSFSIFLIVLALRRSRRSDDVDVGGRRRGDGGLSSHPRQRRDPRSGRRCVRSSSCSRVWKREPSARWRAAASAYLSGWALVVALEGLAYLWAAHDFFLRFHVVNRHYGTLDSIAQVGTEHRSAHDPVQPLSAAHVVAAGGWGHLNQDQAYHALLFCLASSRSWRRRASCSIRRRTRATGCVPSPASRSPRLVAWPLLYHQFGSQSLTHFVPMHRLSRHLVVYAPGAIFAMVAGCFLIARRRPRGAFANGSSERWRWPRVGDAAGPLYFNWRGEQIAYDAFHRIKGTYARIREHLPTASGRSSPTRATCAFSISG